MKKLFSIFFWMIFVTALTQCRGLEGPGGPPGPQGPSGPRGQEGPMTLSLMYEYENYKLNTANNYTFLFNFPAEDLQYILPEDKVLVYLLESVKDGVDIWRLMPVINFNDEGILKFDYNFSHGEDFSDVFIYAETNYGYETLGELTLTSRFVVVPTEFRTNGRSKQPLNFENYEEVINALGIENYKSNGIPLSHYKTKK
ncbi:MAG: hypothetical protein M3512_04330 [Bacteroidota bacterium]|nr:hypothetical protein [Bacteroidota bacterium]